MEGLGAGVDLFSVEGRDDVSEGAGDVLVVEEAGTGLLDGGVVGVEGPDAGGRPQGRGGGGKAAFDEYGRSPTSVVGDSSSLRGLDASAVERSAFGIEALEQIAQNGDDPGVQAVFRKIFAGWYKPELAREYRRGRDDALEESKAGGGEQPGETESGRRARQEADLGGLVDELLGEEE